MSIDIRDLLELSQLIFKNANPSPSVFQKDYKRCYVVLAAVHHFAKRKSPVLGIAEICAIPRIAKISMLPYTPHNVFQLMISFGNAMAPADIIAVMRGRYSLVEAVERIYRLYWDYPSQFSAGETLP